jgi:predicted metalloprotease with PDZ domain
VALLRGVAERWPNTDAGDAAKRLLKEVANDEARARAVAEQGGKAESELLTAQAKALERFGEKADALRAWRLLARAQPDTAAGKKAAEEAKRLAEVLATTPYLGVGFEPNSLLVTQVVRGGPADKAGLTAGDKLLKIGTVKVTTQEQVRQALAKHKPGDKIDLEVERGGKVTKLSAEVGAPSVDE